MSPATSATPEPSKSEKTEVLEPVKKPTEQKQVEKPVANKPSRMRRIWEGFKTSPLYRSLSAVKNWTLVHAGFRASAKSNDELASKEELDKFLAQSKDPRKGLDRDEQGANKEQSKGTSKDQSRDTSNDASREAEAKSGYVGRHRTPGEPAQLSAEEVAAKNAYKGRHAKGDLDSNIKNMAAEIASGAAKYELVPDLQIVSFARARMNDRGTFHRRALDAFAADEIGGRHIGRIAHNAGLQEAQVNQDVKRSIAAAILASVNERVGNVPKSSRSDVSVQENMSSAELAQHAANARSAANSLIAPLAPKIAKPQMQTAREKTEKFARIREAKQPLTSEQYSEAMKQIRESWEANPDARIVFGGRDGLLNQMAKTHQARIKRIEKSEAGKQAAAKARSEAGTSAKPASEKTASPKAPETAAPNAAAKAQPTKQRSAPDLGL